jgi:hypothetical protein
VRSNRRNQNGTCARAGHRCACSSTVAVATLTFHGSGAFACARPPITSLLPLIANSTDLSPAVRSPRLAPVSGERTPPGENATLPEQPRQESVAPFPLFQRKPRLVSPPRPRTKRGLAHRPKRAHGNTNHFLGPRAARRCSGASCWRASERGHWTSVLASGRKLMMASTGHRSAHPAAVGIWRS